MSTSLDDSFRALAEAATAEIAAGRASEDADPIMTDLPNPDAEMPAEAPAESAAADTETPAAEPAAAEATPAPELPQEPQPEPAPEMEAAPPAPEAQVQTEPEPAPAPEPEIAAAPEPEPEVAAEPEPEIEAETETEIASEIAAPQPEAEAADGDGGESVVSKNFNIKGDLNCHDILVIEGTVEGNIECQVLTVTETGKITGDIRAKTVDMRGKLTGSIEADELSIAASAHVVGNLVAHKTVGIEPGAHFEGNCKTQNAGANVVSAPAPSNPDTAVASGEGPTIEDMVNQLKANAG